MHGGLPNLYVAALCNLLHFPVVQEVCEWPPSWPSSGKGTVFIYNRLLFRHCAAVLVISETIEHNIKRLSVFAKRLFPIVRIPVLVDPSEVSTDTSVSPPHPVLVWCGDASGYIRDVLFFIDVLAELRKQRHNCFLEIIGETSKQVTEQIHGRLAELNMPVTQVRVLGYLTRREMLNHCHDGTAVMLPLWDDERSRSRFPNKLGEYLLQGVPVVTCLIGEVGRYLKDSETAIIYRTGDVVDCARAVLVLVTDQETRDAVGRTGKLLAERLFAYQVYGYQLARLFRKGQIGLSLESGT
jgi:glycosyltransferase involved in cell wall biosynthesis